MQLKVKICGAPSKAAARRDKAGSSKRNCVWNSINRQDKKNKIEEVGKIRLLVIAAETTTHQNNNLAMVMMTVI